ncbi:SusC/RagA family TonB-linked outer membrane protein [Flavobacterium sp.]|uniref:SusC/RagA family TonB-linked outer membrane protein n=1 Tax=Flavobacterium sp. TaxID=239 RepID=UPI00374DADE7
MRSKFKWIFTLLVALTMQLSFAQEKTVKGIVTDAAGPMPGVNVVIKGTQRGVSTGFDGTYSIKASVGEVLVFSFMGMNDISRTVESSGVINVKMQDDTKVLETVVVQALGIRRSKDAVVSAQKQISSKELTQANNPNVVQSLTGKVSGLNVSTTSNSVAPDIRIVLRGNRTITGDNQALVVIDGAISSATILNQLPPDVIESVNVIKGAQGAALYGAQGVNGVIIATTKKGSKKEKFTFGINSGIDFESIAFVPKRQLEYGQGWATDPGFEDPANPGVLPTFVPWENGSWGPAYNTPGFPSMVPVGLPQADGNFLFTEWKPIKDNIKQFFKTGLIYQNGFNFNVGGADSYAFLSVNRQNTDYMVEGDKLVRNSFLFKAGKKVGKFNIDGNVNYITQNTSQADSNLWDDLIQTASNVPVSRFENSDNESNWTVYAYNPWWAAKNRRSDAKSNIMNGVLSLGYDLTKNINVSYTANVQVRNAEQQAFNNGFADSGRVFSIAPYEYYGANVETYSDLGGQPETSNFFANQSTTRNIYGDLMFNFDYKLTENLGLRFNIGNNIQDRMFRETSQGGTNLDVPGFYHISNVLSPLNPTGLRNAGWDNRLVRSRIVAGFANVDLAYKDYMFLNATTRIEQSSVVKGSYMYPSVGVSFIPTKAFTALKDGKVLNYMKLNASYTSVGNTSAVLPYETNVVTTIPQGFPFGDLASLQYDRTPTELNIKPEFVNTLEFGGQLGFFNDRITLEGSYYVAETKDLISNVTASRASGNTVVKNNIGDLENKGFEIDLGLRPIYNDNFKWDIKANYATFNTKITALGDGATSISLQSNTQVGIFAEVGEEFPLIKGTAFVRDDNGNVIVGANGLPLRTSTFEKLGKGVPDYIVGLSNSFEYKGLRLVVVADYRNGASAYSFTKNLLYFTGGDLDTSGFDRTQGYVFPGVDSTGATNTIPAQNNASSAGVLNYFTTIHRQVGEANVIDMSALRVRELSLSYALPKKILEKAGLGLESLRFGINARNPFTFLADGTLLKAKNGLENRGYADPEASNTTGNSQGIINTDRYPSSRTLGFSVNLIF